VGSRVGGLTDLHLHPYSHIMSPTDHRIILYLTIFAVAGSRVQAFIFQVPRYPFCTQRSTIYIMTVRLVAGYRAPKYFISLVSKSDRPLPTLSLFSIIRNRGFGVPGLAGSQKFPNPNFSRPSPPPSCFSQYTFSMV
jgi:hypothetical protein